jgi:class 3 adenylate cyclase
LAAASMGRGSIRGITVNLAARMEQTAPAGALRISHEHLPPCARFCSTWSRSRRCSVKGLDQPVVTYLVLRASRALSVSPRAASKASKLE